MNQEQEIKAEQQRTRQQNKSLHKYCTLLAEELNNHGVSMKAFISDIFVDHTMESVKSLFRAIAEKKYGKTSTASFTTKQIKEVYEEVNRHTSQFGISIAWPSREAEAWDKMASESKW